MISSLCSLLGFYVPPLSYYLANSWLAFCSQLLQSAYCYYCFPGFNLIIGCLCFALNSLIGSGFQFFKLNFNFLAGLLPFIFLFSLLPVHIFSLLFLEPCLLYQKHTDSRYCVFQTQLFLKSLMPLSFVFLHSTSVSYLFSHLVLFQLINQFSQCIFLCLPQ